MLNARVRKFMATSDPKENIAFLVHIKTDADLDAVAGIADLAQRRMAIRSMYEEMKHPVMSALSAYAGDGLRVINPLDGTPQLIAEGPANVWKRVVGENADLFGDPDIALIPNENMAVAML